MTRYLSTLALALAATVLAPQVQAETIITYREGQRVNPQDVARVLGKPTRSIRLLDGAPAAPAAAAAVVAVAAVSAATPAQTAAPADGPADEASALSLPVRFAFASTEILPAARAQLDSLAEGIKLLSPERSVTVEGHTDAAGSEAYNRELSRERARAVLDYLVREHGIDASRLKTVGYGEDRLLDSSDPLASVNRRVQFRGS